MTPGELELVEILSRLLPTFIWSAPMHIASDAVLALEERGVDVDTLLDKAARRHRQPGALTTLAAVLPRVLVATDAAFNEELFRRLEAKGFNMKPLRAGMREARRKKRT
jgi:hypothetical protein